MTGDHLDNEVSVNGQLTENGVKFGAKSRALAAFDRLVGGLIDLANAPVENLAKRTRAKGQADVIAIERASELRHSLIDDDPARAQAIFEHQLKLIGRRHRNKAAVAHVALEDLRLQPPTDDQNSAGPELLSDAFMDRFERYADDASTDELRERWGRILASEIRSPGTFSPKVLRVVDEIDPEMAALFEELSQYRLGDAIPKILARKLSYIEEQHLAAADLILDPSMGTLRLSRTKVLDSGNELVVIAMTDYVLTFDKVPIPPVQNADEPRATVAHSQGAGVPVYLLTPAGNAIASILKADQKQNAFRLAGWVAEELRGTEISVYDRTTGTAILASKFQR